MYVDCKKEDAMSAVSILLKLKPPSNLKGILLRHRKSAEDENYVKKTVRFKTRIATTAKRKFPKRPATPAPNRKSGPRNSCSAKKEKPNSRKKSCVLYLKSPRSKKHKLAKI